MGFSCRVPQLPPRHRCVRAGATIMTSAAELCAPEMSSPSLTGTRIRLDRLTDREHPRCDNVATIGSGGTGMFAASLTCATCDRHRGWLSETAIKFIQETRARFGAREVITLRTLSSSRALPGAGNEDQIHSATGDNPQMKRDEVFPSKYLKASDLNGKPIVVTIESAPLEVLKNPEGKEQHKTVLYFKGAKKALPLNVGNWDAVAEICGEDTDDWSGGKIELYAAKTHMGGKVVDCIRVRAPSDAAAKIAPPTKAAEPEAEDMNDAIPF
jgi:hypothetical protein